MTAVPIDRENDPIDRQIERFQSDRAQLTAALDAMQRDDAASLPLLNEADQARLLAVCDRLPYRTATKTIGGPGREVHQDFELCADIADDSPLHDLARALDRWIHTALAIMADPPIGRDLRFNDLMVQRYYPGSRGITPHRDHITYRNIVALVTLSGRARFFICADRSGRDQREIAMTPGNLILMRAPGFADREDRPFHLLNGVTETRVGLGFRHEVPR